MSHIGTKEIKVPTNVSVKIAGDTVYVNGILGQLSSNFMYMNFKQIDNTIIIMPKETLTTKEAKKAAILWGTFRTQIYNMIVGVSQGYSRSVELIGVGYKASVNSSSRILQLKIGNSYEMLYPIPKDISIECTRPTLVTVTGIEKQRVSQTAAEIRAYRCPEPYKGKGIRYVNEVVRMKEGKKK